MCKTYARTPETETFEQFGGNALDIASKALRQQQAGLGETPKMSAQLTLLTYRISSERPVKSRNHSTIEVGPLSR